MIKIVIPYRDRLDYLRLTLATLKESARGHDIHVTLYNTCPKKEENNLGILEEFDSIEVKNIICKNIDTLIPKVIDDAFKNVHDEYIILLDSDTVVHPKAIEKFLQMYNDLPQMGLGTLFNTMEHPFNVIIRPEQTYGIKLTIGGFGCIIKRRAWIKYGKKIRQHWDVEMSNNIAKSGEFNVYCSINSYLEHIGYSGTHRRNDLGHPMSIDRASNFFNENEKG